MNKGMNLLLIALGCLLANGCQAGWLNPSQPGFVIQTFTSYDPISGNNSGTIATNGNSFQFAGDNTGYVFMGAPGSQFRGLNDGNVYVNADGAFVLGSFASLSAVTNKGKGSLLLGNLSAGQRAVITDVGNGSILIGAGTVSNSQAIVVGDANESHGNKSVTAGSFWATGSGFHGSGAGLTDLPAAYPADVPLLVSYTYFQFTVKTTSFGPSVWRSGQLRISGGADGGVDYSALLSVPVTIGQLRVSLPLADAAGRLYPLAVAPPAGSGKFLCSTGTNDNEATWADGVVLGGSSPTFNVVTGTAFAVAGYGRLMVVNGTQLVFVAGSVTNVLDGDIGRE